LVFADSERLAGKDRGHARGQLRSILSRLRNHVGARPVLLAWAKADVEVPRGIAESLLVALRESIPHAQEAKITKARPNSILEVASSLVIEALRAPRAAPLVLSPLENSPYGAFRGHR
jgi:hypothetical protein